MHVVHTFKDWRFKMSDALMFNGTSITGIDGSVSPIDTKTVSLLILFASILALYMGKSDIALFIIIFYLIYMEVM